MDKNLIFPITKRKEEIAEEVSDAVYLNMKGVIDALDKVAILAVTDANGTILYVNDKFVEISKYSREELIGKNHRILKSGYHKPEFFQNLWSTISRGEVWRGDVKNRAKDGTYYWVDTNIAPVMGDYGTPARYVAVRFPITEQKRLDEAKSHFISVASHQLRTPLSAIRLYGEVLADPASGKLNKTQKEYLQSMRWSAEQMIGTVSDLLAVSNIETGKLQVGREPVELVSFLQLLVADVRNITELTKTRSEIQLRAKPNKSAVVMSDSHLLRQVVRNVLLNAVRYSQSEKYDIIVELKEQNDSYVISVQDFGIGIPDEAKPHIFQMFFRSKNALEKSPDGTGIGLYAAKMITEELGGKIWFESVVNKGTTFYIALPKSTTTLSH